MKKGRTCQTSDEDKITQEIIQLGEITTKDTVKILLKKCLKVGRIPENWPNAKVILLYKKKRQIQHSKLPPN